MGKQKKNKIKRNKTRADYEDKIKFIKCPMYRTSFYFINAKNGNEYNKISRTINKNLQDVEWNEVAGGMLTIIDKDDPKFKTYIMWCDVNNYSNLAHEAFHLAHAILFERGCVLEDQAGEHYAYLISWIIDEIRG